MKMELYLLSPTEEFANKHVCIKHWNYQWRRSRASYLESDKSPKVRKESFGGLMQIPSGELIKLDHEAYFYMNLLFGDTIKTLG